MNNILLAKFPITVSNKVIARQEIIGLKPSLGGKPLMFVVYIYESYHNVDDSKCSQRPLVYMYIASLLANLLANL